MSPSDPELLVPGVVMVPCEARCGWYVPLPSDDPRVATGDVLCVDCNPATRGKAQLEKCDCDGCNYGERHTGVWSSKERN